MPHVAIYLHAPVGVAALGARAKTESPAGQECNSTDLVRCPLRCELECVFRRFRRPKDFHLLTVLSMTVLPSYWRRPSNSYVDRFFNDRARSNEMKIAGMKAG